MAQTTTYESILDSMVTQIRAIVPSKVSNVLFTMHRGEDEFLPWVEKNPTACFRRVEIANNFDHEMNGISDGTIWEYVHTCTVMVAYPKAWGKYGIDNMRDADVLIDSDLAQLDNAIGTSGFATFVSGQALSDRRGMTPVSFGGAWVMQLNYKLQYDRSY
jgi:hypothetical protein